MTTIQELEPVAEPFRHSDEDLLQLRIQTLQNELIPFVIQTASDLNSWQAQTLGLLQETLQPDQTVDLPTRSGKSHLIREIAVGGAYHGNRMAIVSHRRHILDEHAEELTARGVNVGAEPEQSPDVLLLSAQKIAMDQEFADRVNDKVDVVLIDEVHRHLGEKTVAGMRKIFPNAVRIAFTATPDFSEDRSVTGEYGEKIITRSIVEAIRAGHVSPVTAFLYVTEGQIDYLDPAVKDFTPRELRRLANFVARNDAIVDIAHDLVQDGRQGFITTIPGEDLLHADLLKKMLDTQQVTMPDGTVRHIRSHVMRGGAKDTPERLQDFEDGAFDILLYCDLLREGLTSRAASFLLNGRPRTSIVDLTQDLGRILQPKDIDAIAIDFMDYSVKHQRTIYDVLELDRSVQGVRFGKRDRPSQPDSDSFVVGDTYLRGLFRPSLTAAFSEYDNRLLAELRYRRDTPRTPLERRRDVFERERAAEFARETKIWERVLAAEGLKPDISPDYFGASEDSIATSVRTTPRPGGMYSYDILGATSLKRRKEAWPGIEHNPATLPVANVQPRYLEKLHPHSRVNEHEVDPAEIVTKSMAELRGALLRAFTILTPRERTLLVKRFGLADGFPKSLEETGQFVGYVTRNRVRQIEAKAMAFLRHSKISAPLRMFVDEMGEFMDLPHDTVNWGVQAAGSDQPKPTSQPLARQRPKPEKRQITAAQITANREMIKQRDGFYRQLKALTGSTDSRDMEKAFGFFRYLASELDIKLDFGAYSQLLTGFSKYDRNATLGDTLTILKQAEQETELPGGGWVSAWQQQVKERSSPLAYRIAHNEALNRHVQELKRLYAVYEERLRAGKPRIAQ